MQTELPVVESKKKIDSKFGLVKIHLFIYLVENNKSENYTNRELEVLTHLYCGKGIEDKESMQQFFQFCYKNNYVKEGAENSIRNIFSKAKEDGILKRKKVNHWKFQKDLLSEYDSDVLVFKYLLTNYR